MHTSYYFQDCLPFNEKLITVILRFPKVIMLTIGHLKFVGNALNLHNSFYIILYFCSRDFFYFEIYKNYSKK